MELPDFLGFEDFNRVRSRMGAERLGAFEFFDPRLHLTADERVRLAGGIEAGWSVLRCLHDYTLAYKNSRVLLWVQVAGTDPEAQIYHLAYCRTLQKLRRERPEQRLGLGTRLPDTDTWPKRVCASCLQQLQFQGYDAARTRHRNYSERVLEDFDLEAFFRQYPVYPLASKVLLALDSVG
ncbi:hypothetical protein [Marinimicrobium sp. ABcell2]|uniref:hypothetical protein n=1 Tax=Marinimicrobium sp. ABcell2 TaxID=3069751 RepID=UPI0027B74019|nr:hypothetical protein [Marinimicrobium sp. ABcell2]MDQ2075287.1 hypothetical protein [Marinimicrobium sp. ABcell2]